MATNLLKNPNGNENLDNWEVTQSGGDGWTVEDFTGGWVPAFSNEDVTKYFANSFELCLKKQEINLLDHYSTDQLDAAPSVTVEDWYCCRSDCGCTYQINVCLLDENHQVIGQFQPEVVTLDPENNQSWIQVTHTFSDYGPGLRYISFEHGGVDTKYWKGFFGVRVTASSITVNV